MWGTRGSLAAPGHQTVRYGGNTSCLEVRLGDETVVILDAGTGARPLGDHLVEEGVREIHVLLSHLHLDHLQRLAFFGPLYERDVNLQVWGPPSTLQPLGTRIGTYMSDPLFPVSLSDIPCRVDFHNAPLEATPLGSATVRAAQVIHLGVTLGWRLEENGRSLVYIPDHEPALGGDISALDTSWISGAELATGADVLFHDAQYAEYEYPRHVGWGHSSVEHVVTLARRTNVQRLVLFHHDPRHGDDDLDELLARAVTLWGDDGHAPVLAEEGMEITIE